MPGFGHGPFGQFPFGEWDWGQQVLYNYYPQLDQGQDQQIALSGQNFALPGETPIGPLQAFSTGLIPSYDQLRHMMRDFLSLRDAFAARTQYDTLTLLMLGPRILPPVTVDQQGIDGRINAKLLFVAMSARFQSTDVGNQIIITGSSIPGNNRTVTISSVIGLTTCRVTPFLEFDNGPLDWELITPETASTTQTTFEIEYGDPSQITVNWDITDGRGNYNVLARQMLSATTSQQGLDGVLVTGGIPGVFEAPSGLFLPKDYGRFITIANSQYVNNNGRFQIQQVIPPPSTLVAVGSNGQALNALTGGILNVVSTVGFSSSGSLNVSTTLGTQVANYTGTTSTSFTGVTASSAGGVSTGGSVVEVANTQVLLSRGLVADIFSLTNDGINTTITTTAPHGLVSGQDIEISGVSDPRFNGQFTNVTVIYNVSPLISTQFEFPQTFSQYTLSVGGSMLIAQVPPDEIASITGTGSFLEVTTEIPLGVFIGQTVVLIGTPTVFTQGVTTVNVDGIYTVLSVVSLTEFTVASTATGTGAGGSALRCNPLQNPIISATNDGVNTTVTNENSNNISVGQLVVLIGQSNTALDGVFPVAAVVSDTIFSVLLSMPVTTNPAGTFTPLNSLFEPNGTTQQIEQISNNGNTTTVDIPNAITIYGSFSAVSGPQPPTSFGTITPSGSPLSLVTVTILITQTSVALGSGTFTYSVNGSNYYFSPLTFIGTGTGLLSPTGTPSNFVNYPVVVKIITGGAVGTATFQYSLNAGSSFSGTLTTGGSVPTSAGFNLSFSGSGFVATDTWEFQAVGPYLIPTSGVFPISTIAYNSITPLQINITMTASVPQPLTAGTIYTFMVVPTPVQIAGDSFPAFNGVFLVNPTQNSSTISFLQTLSSPETVPGGQVARIQGLISGSFTQDSGPLTWALLPRALITVNNTAPAIIGWVERYGSDLSIVLPASSIGSVTFSGTGTGTITPSGTPSGSFDIVIQISATGVAGVATFEYSIDNGSTFSPSFLIPAVGTYTIQEASIQLSFNAGTYNFGDLFSFETSGLDTTIVASPTAMFDLGSFTTVTHVPTGAITGTVTPSGVPLQTYQGTASVSGVAVTITAPGGPGAGGFSYSLNGAPATTPTTIPTDGIVSIPDSGFYLNFSGSFAAGETYSFNVTASGDVGKLLTIRGTGTQDGTYTIETLLDSQHAALDADLQVQAGPLYWEIRTQTNIGDGTQVQTNAPSLLAFLAEDFGLQISPLEPANVQQAYVGNVASWINEKGLPASYSTLGSMTGYDVGVQQLWRIPQDYGQNYTGNPVPPPLIATADFFVVGDGQLGHSGVDGFLIQGPDGRIQFGSPTLQLSYRDIGSQIQINGAATPANNKLYTIQDLVIASFGGATLFPLTSEIVHIGSSNGIVVPSGYTTTNYSFVIRIDPPLTNSSNPLAPSFAYSLNGGATFSNDQPIRLSTTGIGAVTDPLPLGSTGVSVAFYGAFNTNDTYSFSPLLAAEFRPADTVPDVVVPDPHNSNPATAVVAPGGAVPPAASPGGPTGTGTSIGYETAVVLQSTSGLFWSLVRTYTDFEPDLGSFDEVNAEFLAQIVDSDFTTVLHVGSGTGVVAPGGAILPLPPLVPNWTVLIVISTAGTLTAGGPSTTAQFTYSLNGGPASTPRTLPLVPPTSNPPLPLTPVTIGTTGITVTFSAGTYVLSDNYSFTATLSDTFTLDKYSWEEDFQAQVNVAILATFQLNATTWQITVQGIEQNGATYPNSPSVVLAVGHFALIDTTGNLYYLETVPQVTPAGYYSFNILSGVSPVLGTGAIAYLPYVQPNCDYCGSYKILASVEKNENFPQTNLAIQQAEQRLLTRLQQTLPEHAALVASLIDNGLFAQLTITASIEAGIEIEDLYAPVGANYDSVEGDVAPSVIFAGSYKVVHTGSGVGTITAGGIPPGGQAFGVYTILITITTSGGLGTGAFTYQVNGGSVSAPQTVPANGTFVVPPTGVQLTFTGAMQSGDTYTITTGVVTIQTLGILPAEQDFRIDTSGAVGIGQLAASSYFDTAVASGSSGQALNTLTILNVASTAGFAPGPGNLKVYTSTGVASATYTTSTPTSFTGFASASTGVVQTGYSVAGYGEDIAIPATYTPSGLDTTFAFAGTFQAGNYYSFLVGAQQTSPEYGPTTFYADTEIYSLNVSTLHTSVNTAPTTVLLASNGQALNALTGDALNVVSTANFAGSGTINVNATVAGQLSPVIVSYTGTTPTSFTGIVSSSAGVVNTGNEVYGTGSVSLIGSAAGSFDFLFAITGSGGLGSATYSYLINNGQGGSSAVTGTIPAPVGALTYSLLPIPGTGNLSFLFTGSSFQAGDAYVIGGFPPIKYVTTVMGNPGTIIPIGYAPPPSSFVITITGTGGLGTATFSYTINLGSPVSGTVPSGGSNSFSVFTDVSTGVGLFFAGNFAATDVYSFTVV